MFCGICLFGVLLYPYEFKFPARNESNHVQWISGNGGIEFSNLGMVISEDSPKKLYGMLMRGEGMTVEVWIRSMDIRQGGPARIISFSYDPWFRNFTMGQQERDLVIRMRTLNTNLDGSDPELTVRNIISPEEIYQLVMTYDYKVQRVFVNGHMVVETSAPGGKLSNWDTSYPLILGNEKTGNRPWHGQLFLAAVYNRSLSSKEVSGNFMAGVANPKEGKGLQERVGDGLVTLYLFDEMSGNVVKNQLSSITEANLTIPTMLNIPTLRSGSYKIFLDTDFIADIDHFTDIFLNILAFIPFGFFLHGTIEKHSKRFRFPVGTVLLTAMAFSLAVESLQYFTEERTSDVYDVVSNCLGAILGAAVERRL